MPLWPDGSDDHPVDYMERPIHEGDVLAVPTIRGPVIMMTEARVFERSRRADGGWSIRVQAERVGKLYRNGEPYWLHDTTNSVLVVCWHRGRKWGYIEVEVE